MYSVPHQFCSLLGYLKQFDLKQSLNKQSISMVQDKQKTGKNLRKTPSFDRCSQKKNLG